MKSFSIRPISSTDNPEVAKLIRLVMPEFGAKGPGFAINDPEVDAMFEAYQGQEFGYWVVTDEDGVVRGGGGYAPLAGGPVDTCELRKMYFQAELRGRGFGGKLLSLIIDQAGQSGFRQCYLETLAGMHQAQALYEAFGFKRIMEPLGKTGHFSCDRWYLKQL